MDTQISDKELAEGVRQGDKKAFRKLYDRYHKQLFFFAKRYLKEKNLVEDAVQETFIKLWKKRDTVKGATIKGLLFTMIKNHVLNMIRDRKTRRRILDNYKQVARKVERNPTEEDLILDEYRELVHRALDNLSPARHRVFKMKNFDGMTNTKIAEIRDVSVNTVKTQFYLGTRFIRNFLKKHADI